MAVCPAANPPWQQAVGDDVQQARGHSAEGRGAEPLAASMAGAAGAAQGLAADMGVARQYVAATLEGAAGDSPLGALMQGVLVRIHGLLLPCVCSQGSTAGHARVCAHPRHNKC